MNWEAIRSALMTPVGYLRSIHSEGTPDSHGRWTVTGFMVVSGYILCHAQTHHVPLDPTISTTILGLGGLVVGRATAVKIFGEKETNPAARDNPPSP